METTLHISALTPSTLTRPRGEVAGRKVAASIKAVAVELDLGETVPSLSFLDGLVLTLQEKQVLHLVTFVTTNPAVLSRLVRIAGERGVTLSLRSESVRTNPHVAPVQSFELDEHLEQARAQSKFAQI